MSSSLGVVTGFNGLSKFKKNLVAGRSDTKLVERGDTVVIARVVRYMRKVGFQGRLPNLHLGASPAATSSYVSRTLHLLTIPFKYTIMSDISLSNYDKYKCASGPISMLSDSGIPIDPQIVSCL